MSFAYSEIEGKSSHDRNYIRMTAQTMAAMLLVRID